MLFQYTTEDQLDSQARLLIPKNLIEFAGINKEVFILGATNKIEVWNPETYNQYIMGSDKSFEEIANEVFHKKKQ